MQLFRNLEKLLESIEKQNEQRKRIAHYHEIGYSTRCKTCNHPQLEDIERLYNDGYTYQQIIDELDLKDISIMALSRHFKNHYPKSQEYKLKQRKLALERITHAMKRWPFLEQYFMEQDDEFIKQFAKHNGFCVDKMGLCQYIRPGHVSNCENITDITLDIMQRDLKNAYSHQKANIILNNHDDVLKCLQCKNKIDEQRLNLMEQFICNEILGVECDSKQLYASWLRSSIDKQSFIEDMKNAKEKLEDQLAET